MFNYTTETILNDLSRVKYLIGGLTANAKNTPFDPGIEVGKKALFIERLNKFVIDGTYDHITAIYKRAATAAVQAVRQITIPTVVSGTLYRLGVTITTGGYATPMYARDRVLYGKPFYMEQVATATTNTVLAAAFVTAWNKNFSSYDDFAVASLSGADVVFKSVNNPFAQFQTIVLESIDATTGIATNLNATVSAGTGGVAPFGDYTDLLRNHRLPTIDNYRPFGLNQEELPVVGATYDQYTITYEADRGEMGQSVVGQLATSRTTHVLWVNTAASAVTLHTEIGTDGQTGTYTWEQVLSAVGLVIKDAQTGATVTVVAATESTPVTTTTTTAAVTTTTTTAVPVTTTTTTTA